MGYQKKTYNLNWDEGHDLHGLEVSMRGVSIGDLEVIAAMRGETEKASTFERIQPMLEIFVKSLVKWNYEESDGTPVGTSLEEIRSGGDIRDVMTIISDWVAKVGNISSPLVENSSSGEQFPEGSLTMEAL